MNPKLMCGIEMCFSANVENRHGLQKYN